MISNHAQTPKDASGRQIVLQQRSAEDIWQTVSGGRQAMLFLRGFEKGVATAMVARVRESVRLMKFMARCC